MIGWPRALARVLRAEQPDLVHLHGPSAGSIGAWMARRAGTGPIIYTEHREHHERSLPMRMARRAAAGIPDMNVAISRAVAGALIQKAKVDRDRVRVILNGVPLAERAERPAAEEPSRLLYVANLWPRKDHATLLRAFSLLDPAYELILVGDGPLRGQLEQRARDLGIAGRVRFAGSLADPWSLTVEGISVYVHPPTDEAGGLAVMEAMMRGLPVVATATGGVPEILRDGVDGLLVPPADASALASAIERLRSDHALAARLAQHAFEVAHERLTIGACLEAYLALYRDVLTGTKDVPRNDDGR
jgi:glycosyltransferase involved in cell wall biosynthesis